MVESDFNKIYGILDPLKLEWRKFYRLLSTMPLEDSLFFSPQYKELVDQSSGENPVDDDKDWWKKELDQRRGRTSRPRVATTIDEMITNQKNIGRE